MGSVCSKENCAEIEEVCYLMCLGHDKFAEERASLTENEIPSFTSEAIHPPPIPQGTSVQRLIDDSAGCDLSNDHYFPANKTCHSKLLCEVSL